MERMRLLPRGVLLWSALLSFPGAALAQWTGGADVKVNQDPAGLNQVETSIALNPARPGNMLVVHNDQPWPGGPGLGYSYTLDGGLTWTDGQFAVPPGMVMFFDPMAAADANGTLYAGGCVNDNTVNGNSAVLIWSSPDGGITWAGPVTVSADGPQVPPAPATLNDRGHMAADDAPGSPFAGNVYVTWIRDVGTTGPSSDCWFNASGPGGASFMGRQKISDPASGVGRVHAPHVATATDGTIYVVWADYDVTVSQSPAILYLDRSTDGGISFGPDVWINAPMQIVTQPVLFTDPAGPPTQGDTAPVVAVNPLNPLDVYVVYAADPDLPMTGDEGDIYFITSGDGGNSWLPPVRVNGAPFNTGVQYAPWIDVKPDGTIDVAWYDAQYADAVPLLWAVLMSRSTDGGQTWVGPLIVSDVPSVAPINPMAPTLWLGEYLALAVDDTAAHVAWASSVGDPVGDIWYDRINNRVFSDCDGNGIPDYLDLWNCAGNPFCLDCNLNQILDGCDIDPTDPDGNGRVSADVNGNLIPDECEPTGVPTPAPGALQLVAVPSVMSDATVLRFGRALEAGGQVTVHDLQGRIVRRIAVAPGASETVWDGTDETGKRIRPGPYFVRLEHAGRTASTRVVVIR